MNSLGISLESLEEVTRFCLTERVDGDKETQSIQAMTLEHYECV